MRLERPDIEVVHGGHVSHADPYATRARKKTMPTPGDPLALLMAHVKRSNLRLMDFFAQLDKDNSMSLTKSEFRKGMRSAKVPLTDEQIEKLMEKLDLDRNGTIDFA